MSHIFICYIRLSIAHIKQLMVQRFSIIAYIFGLIFIYFFFFLNFWVIMSRFGSLKYWTLGQIVFIYMICLISYGLRNMLFYKLTEMDSMIQAGDVDRILVRPINTLIYVMGSRFEIGGIAHIATGFLLFIIYGSKFGITWNVFNIIFFILAIISATLVQGAITLFIAACAFFLISTGGLNTFYSSLREFIFYPVTLYNKVIKFILFFILPLAFASYVPAGIFLDNQEYSILPKWVWRLSILFGLVFFMIAYAFWKKALKHYQSTGS